MKSEIKIKFSFRKQDQKKWYSDFFTQILEKRYSITIDENKPDFIFHEAHLIDVLKYSGVRISIAGENVRTDFNISDYGLGFDHLRFLDRYLRYPLYLLYSRSLQIAERRGDNLLHQKQEDLVNRRFCNFLVSNGNASQFRTQFFHELSKYKQVDSGGRYLKNVNDIVNNKLGWQRKYKFSICFENSCTSGYLTEKLIQAYAAVTIPIYWGDPDAIGSLEMDKGGINPKAIICVDSNFPDKAIQQIQELDSIPDLYMKTLNEPLFLDIGHSHKFNQSLEDFLFSIFDQKKDLSFRRGFGQMRLRVENRNIARSSIVKSLVNFLKKRTK